MDFLRVMDQINPVDSRRGFADVEFEETVIPINMLRAEYWPDLSGSDMFFDQLGFQLVVVPNGNFIPDQGPSLGNDAGGIWSYDYADGGIRYGDINSDIKEPGKWSTEIGFRIQALSGFDTIFTLNGFYGRANSSGGTV